MPRSDLSSMSYSTRSRRSCQASTARDPLLSNSPKSISAFGYRFEKSTMYSLAHSKEHRSHERRRENVTTDTDQQKGYASVNGLDLYYEIRGSGEPLVLLPGGFMTIEAMGELVPQLAAARRVIGVELQGHGHTADIERPLRFEFMADDIAALIKHLGLEQADIFGFSLGGGVALQTAIRHPEVVRKLVVVSAPSKRDGWYPEVLVGMASMNAEAAEAMVGSPMHQAYVSVAPKPEDWSALVARLGQLLRQDYDWSTAVASIKAPTLIVVGDADSVRPAHAVELFGLLGGGKVDGELGNREIAQFAVLPGTTEFSLLSRTDLLLPIITPFLEAPMPKADQILGLEVKRDV